MVFKLIFTLNNCQYFCTSSHTYENRLFCYKVDLHNTAGSLQGGLDLELYPLSLLTLRVRGNVDHWQAQWVTEAHEVYLPRDISIFVKH